MSKIEKGALIADNFVKWMALILDYIIDQIIFSV